MRRHARGLLALRLRERRAALGGRVLDARGVVTVSLRPLADLALVPDSLWPS